MLQREGVPIRNILAAAKRAYPFRSWSKVGAGTAPNPDGRGRETRWDDERHLWDG